MKLSHRIFSVLTHLIVTLGLSACGGGGGSAGTVPNATPTTPTMTVSIQTAAGAATQYVSLGGGHTVKASYKDASNKPMVGKMVEFELQPSNLATLSPLTALTDSQGIATVAIAPTSVSAQGAGRISAKVTDGEVTTTGKLDFAVQQLNLTLSPISLGSTSLTSGGNTSVSVQVNLNGQPATGVPVSVFFTASCGRLNDQDASSGISIPTDGSSNALVSYRAVAMNGTLCQGQVNLTAQATGTTQTQTAKLVVAAPVANSIVFLSATPAQIFVKGSGAAEQSLVKFRVLSGTTPLSGVTVRFSIPSNSGGVGLSATGQTSPVSVTSDSSGEAWVSVFSGTIPGPVKVRAELASNASVFAESQNLSVASGAPSQRFMSLSVETFNIEGWSRDGTSTNLTVRIADRQGNPVEDGTVINFTAEGGQVQPSCATQRSNGISQCSVTFVSQNPRPASGRGSVLAYVAGTKDYVDNDQNNIFSPGDTLINQGDAYRDDNEDGTWNIGEFIVPTGNTGVCAGAGAPFPSRTDTCDSQLSTTVRQQTVILFSSSQPQLSVTSASTGAINFRLGSLHNPLLPLPAGTVVSAKASDGTPANALDCSVVDVFGSPIANVSPGIDPLANLTTSHAVTLKDCASGDAVVVNVTTPAGLTTSLFVSIP